MVEEQIHSVLMYTVQSTGGFVLILNFQKTQRNSRSRKWSAVDLTSNLGCFQQGGKNKCRSYGDNYHSEGQT